MHQVQYVIDFIQFSKQTTITNILKTEKNIQLNTIKKIIHFYFVFFLLNIQNFLQDFLNYYIITYILFSLSIYLPCFFLNKKKYFTIFSKLKNILILCFCNFNFILINQTRGSFLCFFELLSLRV